MHMKHYCIYTRDFTRCKGLFRNLRDYGIEYEAHINRTRFTLSPFNALHLLFLLRYSHYIVCIDHESDHTLGV